MATAASPRPFIAGRTHWDKNRQAATVQPAIVTTNTGAILHGLRIAQNGLWVIITAANAIQLANDIADTLEQMEQAS